MTDKEKLHQILSSLWKNDDSVGKTYYNQALQDVQTAIDLQKEPVSEELGEIVLEGINFNKSWYAHPELAFKAGAEWLKNNLWKPADGDDLPIIDREVIALLNNGRVVIAHRPPEYWDGKDIITGKVTRNYVERYDKGLWNIPNVKYWLDVDLPK